MLKDPNLGVRVRAAEVLLYFGENEEADALLVILLKDDEVQKRRMALESFGRIAVYNKRALTSFSDLIFNKLDDPSPAVRREAARVAPLVEKEDIAESLVKCFS